MRRLRIVLVVAVGLASACTSGVERVTGVLGSPPTPAPSASPSASPSPTVSSSPTGTPAIVVDSPFPGDELVSPITVRGTADVFEASVSIRILDAAGLDLAAMNTQASCGSGCRGTFIATLAFFTPQRQQGTIEVFEVSAQDGSAINVASIPITLVPGS